MFSMPISAAQGLSVIHVTNFYTREFRIAKTIIKIMGDENMETGEITRAPSLNSH